MVNSPTVLTLTMLLLGASWSAWSGVAAYSGDITWLATPPASVETGVLESDTNIRLFAEQRGVKLTMPLNVDLTVPGTYDSTTPDSPGTISAGTVLNSYFLHLDRVGSIGTSPLTLSGSVTFDETILGVIFSDANLDASDPIVGSPTTTYGTGTSLRGLSASTSDPDRVVWTGTSTIEVELPNFTVTDQVRILTRSRSGSRRNVTFSIDRQSASSGTVAPSFGGGGGTIHEGDLLTPGTGAPGPNPATTVPPAPGIFIWSPDLDLGGLPVREVDAFSFGRDEPDGRLYFSVDEFAVGRGGVAAAPLRTEAAADDASADVFSSRSANPLAGGAPGNRQWIDGNASSRAGLGLMEPNPDASALPDEGDNLDALDVDTSTSDTNGYVYFSLDHNFDDPLEPVDPVVGFGPNYGSACWLELKLYGTSCTVLSGADVFATQPGSGAVTVYASATTLGLGTQEGDDIDALMLSDKAGDAVFDPAVDRIFFSLRRDSPTIRHLDSRLGIEIEEGDVLTIPDGPPWTPAIAVQAEFLGLRTLRGGANQADDLDALDGAVDRRPNMSVRQVRGGMEIQWEESDTGFHLEETPTLNPPTWRPSSLKPVLEDGRWKVQTLPTVDYGFFRLVGDE